MLTLDYLKTLSPADRQREIFQEFLKCKQDPLYTIETYFTVLDASLGKRVPFKLYPHQKKAVKAFLKYPYNLSMKSRQMGFTTLSMAFIAWIMSTRTNQVINALAQEKKTSRKFLRGVRETLDMARKTAPWLIPEYSESNNGRDSFTVSTGCMITAEANKPDACRGDTINWLFIDEISSISHMAEIWASAGITLTKSKGSCIGISCVTEDTYVFTDKGLTRIGDFVDKTIDQSIQQTFEFDKQYSVLGKDKLREGTLFHHNGVSDIYKLTTSYTELKGSPNHKLWVYDSVSKIYDWKILKDITTEDWVNVQYGQDIWGNNDDISDFKVKEGNYKNYFKPEKLTPDLCYLLGLYIAEGYAAVVTRNNKEVGGVLNISCGDDITEVFRRLGLKHNRVGIGTRVNNWCLIQLMQYLGFDLTVKAPKKVIPERLLKCSKENIAALLQGMFDGDGSSNSVNGNVSYASSSEELVNQVRVILLNFGILPCKYKTKLEDLNKNLPEGWCKFTTDSFSVQIFTQNALKFYEKIGFRLERKQNNKKLLQEEKELSFSLPNSPSIVGNLYSNSKTSPWKLATYDKIYISKESNHSDKKVEKLIEIVSKEKNKETLSYIEGLRDKVLIENSCWVKVKSIEKLEEQQPVYDFSLPHTEDFWCHSVIYNGILGHQTPKGSSGWYYEQYSNAAKNGWNIVEAHWSEHPDYSKGMYQWIKDETNPEGGYLKFYNEQWPDVSSPLLLERYKTKETYTYILDGRIRAPWYDYESKKLGIQLTRCELDCSFAGSGSEVLDPEIIRGLSMRAKEFKPLNLEELGFFTKGIYKTLQIYKEYNPDSGYCISADVGTGDGSDFSAFVIIDITKKEVVASYKDIVDPLAYAKVIHQLGTYYGNALAIVEYQGPGLTVLLELKNRLRYSNVYYQDTKKNEPHKTQKRKLGFWQGSQTRTLGGDKTEEVFNTGEYLICTPDLIDELHTWIWEKDGKRRHAPGKHDDLIMAFSNALFYIHHVEPRRKMNRDMMNTHLSWDRIGNLSHTDLLDPMFTMNSEYWKNLDDT